MRTVRRLLLRYLLLRPGYPNPNGFHITVLPSSLSHHVEADHPQRSILSPMSQTSFLLFQGDRAGSSICFGGDAGN